MLTSDFAPDQHISQRDSCSLGMIHGRFQPFHLGHLYYARLALGKCHHLVVGITNPDSRSWCKIDGDDQRHLPSSNPFSYFERCLMIWHSLVQDGTDPSRFCIVPFPIDNLSVATQYIPSQITNFLRDRGEWTIKKIEMLQSIGIQCEVIADNHDLEITGTEVRKRLINGESWERLVPDATQRVLLDIKAPLRLSGLRE